MNLSENQLTRNYDVESATTSESGLPVMTPEVKDFDTDKDRYTSGKPRRIVIRARIIHD